MCSSSEESVRVEVAAEAIEMQPSPDQSVSADDDAFASWHINLQKEFLDSYARKLYEREKEIIRRENMLDIKNENHHISHRNASS
jgi:hypothetical protein